MRRRDFLALCGSAAITRPLAVGAQQPALPVVGYLGGGAPGQRSYLAPAIQEGLKEAGYAAGSVAIEYRWAHGDYARLPVLMQELVARKASVVIADGTPAVRAAKGVTDSVPIVFMIGSDPTSFGFAASFRRPGGNLTGVAMLNSDLIEKRLELLREIVPAAENVALLINPASRNLDRETMIWQAAASAVGLRPNVLRATNEAEIDGAFAAIARMKLGALLVQADVFFDSRRDLLIALAARHAVPACYQWREYPENGGLISYGVSLAEVYRQTGVFAGKILSGARPAELPVQQPMQLELVINMKTAKALGIEVPQSVLTRADEVIE